MKFDWNDLAMAFLGAIFVVFGANLLSEILYHSEVPEQAGYEIEGGPVEVVSGGAEAVVEDASLIMASVDPAAGQNVAKKCVACHNFGEGEANKVGPHLYDVVNRPIASIADFGYSGAMKAYGEGKTWTFTELNGFLYKPKDHVPGTSMGFAGLKKTDERAELLAYLRSLSVNPAPLPDPAEATPAAAEGGAASGTTADAPAAATAEGNAEGAATEGSVEPAPANQGEATTGDAGERAVSPQVAPGTDANPDAATAAPTTGQAVSPTVTGEGASLPTQPVTQPAAQPSTNGAATMPSTDGAADAGQASEGATPAEGTQPAGSTGLTTTTRQTEDGTTITTTRPAPAEPVTPADAAPAPAAPTEAAPTEAAPAETAPAAPEEPRPSN